jgi:hypothetical protein
MAINFVKGQILSSNLERDGIDLAISNANVGIGTIGTITPGARFEVVGNVLIGNVQIGNIGTVSATGNITGGNLATGGLVTATGNISGGNLNTAGNVTSNNTVFAVTVSATGNVSANVFVGNTALMGSVRATANVLVGNITIPATGNINVGNVNIANMSNPVADQDAATKFYVDQNIGNIGTAGNLTFSNTTISTSLVDGNITLNATGNSLVQTGGTYGFVVPAGNTAQRLGTGNVAGTVRFNTDVLRIEVYDGAEWDQIVSGVTNQTLNGDGSTTVFVLDRSTTTAAALIMLNGVVQLPGTAYNISPSPSTNLVFTEAPAISDVIDVRYL